MVNVNESDALVVVDVQPDFMPGGALAVAGGDEIVQGVANLMRRFSIVVATQDWHPAGHASFASTHGRKPFEVIELYGHEQVLWPDHCVQGTPGAMLHAGLPLDRLGHVVQKGTRREVDSYSGFKENWGPDGQRTKTSLADFLCLVCVRSVFIVGLARDYCVRWTLEDAMDLGIPVYLVNDLTRSVVPANDSRVEFDLKKRGVKFVTSGDLVFEDT